MAQADEESPTDTTFPGERWSVADKAQLQETFRLLNIPPLAGYTPVAITAIGVMASPTGELAHYPSYAEVLGTGLAGTAELSEETEVRAAIATLQRWFRVQRQRRQLRGSGQ